MRRIYIDVGIEGDNLIPVVVQNVTATETTGTVTIAWEELVNYNLTGYEIWKKTGSGAYGLLSETATSPIVDENVLAGSTYTYKVRGKNAEGKYTDFSTEASITLEEALQAPADLMVVDSAGSYTIGWTPLDAEVEYEVWKKVDSGSWVLFETTTNAYVNDSDYTSGHTYTYRVRAKDGDIYSDWSNEDSFTTGLGVPSEPLGLVASAVSSSQINLAWDPPANDGGSEITKYIVEFDDGTGWQSVDKFGEPLTYGVQGLDPEQTVQFRVYAVNAQGTGPVSETVSATTNSAVTLNREYDFEWYKTSSKTGGAYVYIPPAARTSPESVDVFVFCHGSGEKSSNSNGPNFDALASAAGLTQFLRGTANNVPLIVVCPQVIGWNGDFDEAIIDEALNAIKYGVEDTANPGTYHTEPLIPALKIDKVHVSGWSSGGGGAWRYAKNYPEKTHSIVSFSTAISLPISASPNDTTTFVAAGVKVWMFHNNNDPTQDTNAHDTFFSNAKSIVPNPVPDQVRYTKYSDSTSHNSVTKTLNGTGGTIVAGNDHTPYGPGEETFWEFITS